MKTYSKLLLLTGILSLVISSCYKDSKEHVYDMEPPPKDCVTTNVSYSSNIQPIMGSCTSCHSGSGAAQGLDLTNYDQIKAKGNLIVQRINGTGGVMPPSGSLPDCDILQIESWVADGAPNN